MPAATSSTQRPARAIALCLAALSCTAATHAGDAACPARHAGKPLAIGYVLDGAADDESVVMPDASGQDGSAEFATWLVDRIYDQGRRVTLECHYDGVAKPLFVLVETPVTTCAYGKTKARAVTLGCE